MGAITTVTARDLMSQIREGSWGFNDLRVKGTFNPTFQVIERIWHAGLRFGDVEFRARVLLQNQRLASLTFNHCLIRGDLSLNEIDISGGLSLTGTTIDGEVFLWRPRIGGNIDLTGFQARVIYVDHEMAELIHWSAPSIPLVIHREERTPGPDVRG